MPFTFSAAYDGECSECGLSIYQGDEIGWVDGSVACEDCVNINASDPEH